MSVMSVDTLIPKQWFKHISISDVIINNAINKNAIEVPVSAHPVVDEFNSSSTEPAPQGHIPHEDVVFATNYILQHVNNEIVKINYLI